MMPSCDRFAALAARHGVVLLLQFGSSVSGATHAHSDLDLAVLVKHVPRSLEAHAALVQDLQDLFPDAEVDLAFINRADPLFLKKITESCRLLHGSAQALRQLEIYAFKRYQDHKKYLAMERHFVARSLAESA